MEGNGDKQLVDLTIGTGRTKGAKAGTLTATDGHPSWVPRTPPMGRGGDLKAGQWLQTSAGTWVQVTAVKNKTGSTAVYNLTVDDLHTCYVLAEATPVLVHNAGGLPCGRPRRWSDGLRRSR
ncbi:polymorphic toxin-type HINT domain-containing protein [Streptomyces sp. RKAG290]|uniref:polymorphic toxin-type HINT domain-containing protein n=1 Tax=Streptomyces sp. RKAG290 TaxID=2888348 RepID=UPI0035A944DF